MSNTRKELEGLLARKQQEASRINFEIQSIREVLQLLEDGQPLAGRKEDLIED